MTVPGTFASTARLLPKGARNATDLAEHLQMHGHLPVPSRAGPDWREAFLHEIEASGLLGRGGAGFPAYLKLRSAATGRTKVLLVVNAMESEPASAKDATLLHCSPHLVLDGAQLGAAAISASKVVVCVPDDREYPGCWVDRAVAERRRAGLAEVPVEVARLNGRYVAGEESALVAALAAKPGVPGYRPDKSVPLSIGRQGTLVHNAETLANMALIARYGAAWYRAAGTGGTAGTCLVTVSGAVTSPGVFEVGLGTPISAILQEAGGLDDAQAVLIGGYGGSWAPLGHLGAGFWPGGLKAIGASIGAGVLLVLAGKACGIRETARIARFMAAESAGQCGPCLFGLPAIAGDLELIAEGSGDEFVLDRLMARCGLVSGRGACHHPDGVARLVRSALATFSADLAGHLRGRPCAWAARPTALRFPGTLPATAAPPERGTSQKARAA